MPGGGLDLAGGWRGSLVQVRGDWQFYCQVFYFPAWNSNERMCPFCRASNVDKACLWTDFGPNATWRDRRWTHESYLNFLRTHGLAIPVFFLLVVGAIGFRLECITVDPLHAIDLGFSSHIVGNVFWYLSVIRNVFAATTYAQRISKLNTRLREWYNKTKCTSRIQGEITIERLRKSAQHWPKLKAKAAATRHVMAFVLELVLMYATPDDPDFGTHDQLMIGVVQLIKRFYELLDDNSMFFSAACLAEMVDIGNMLPNLYGQLADLCFEAGLKLWKLTPKIHLFQHLCLDQVPSFGNPRYFWTYGDEDLVGQLVDIAIGVHPATLGVSVLFKWAVCVFEEVFFCQTSMTKMYRPLRGLTCSILDRCHVSMHCCCRYARPRVIEIEKRR